MSAKKPLSRDVYSELRKMILDFELYPGSRITETELAEMFDVSRTPIRAALQRLEAEGYVSVRPKQGCFVRAIDIESLTQYYQVRIALEMLSLQIACTYMSDADLQALADTWHPDRIEAGGDNSEELEASDEDFHMALAEGGGNLALAHYLNDLNRHIRAIRRLDFTFPERIAQTYREHHGICLHLLRRDLPAAQALMQAHITRSKDFAKTVTLTQLARSRSRMGAQGRVVPT